MTSINTNISAVKAGAMQKAANNLSDIARGRIASGRRINSASDDAAGIAVSTKILSQVLGVETAIRNSADGIALIQIADAAHRNLLGLVTRMRELTIQMMNGTYSHTDRDIANTEIRELRNEFNKIATHTRFNNIELLDGTFDRDFQIGNTSSETLNLRIDGLGISITPQLNGQVQRSRIEEESRAHFEAETTVNVSESTSPITLSVAELGMNKLSKPSGGTYSIRGTDSGDFSVNTTTGQITGNAAFDYEAPAGGAGNNLNKYELELVYTASGVEYVDNVTINVSDVTEISITDPGYNVRVYMTVDSGTISLNSSNVSGLTAPTGYSSADWTNNSSEMVISGSVADINTALIDLSTSVNGATVSLMVTRWDGDSTNTDLDWAYNPDNGHFYSYYENRQYWDNARTFAESYTFNGTSAYLATSTSSSENDFIYSKLPFVSSNGSAWLGGREDPENTTDFTIATEADWYWVTGPEAGTKFFNQSYYDALSPVSGQFTNWHSSQPSDNFDPTVYNEDYLAIDKNGDWVDDNFDFNGAGWNSVIEHPNINSFENFQVTSERSISSIISRTDHELTVSEANRLYIPAAGQMSGRSTLQAYIEAYTGGTMVLSGTDSGLFTVSSDGRIESTGAIDFETKTSYEFTLTYTSGSQVFTENFDITVSDDTTETSVNLIDVDLDTQFNATESLEILDAAVDAITQSQANLGATQNRLSYTINSLSKNVAASRVALGNIIDADLATEASDLAKTTILQQTSLMVNKVSNDNRKALLRLIE